MDSTINYLDKAKEVLKIETDYAFAKRLGLSKAAISQYRNGDRIIDDYTAARIAEVLKINPLEVIAVANMERDKVSERREFWRRIAAGAALGGLLLLLNFQELNEGAGFFGLVESIPYAQFNDGSRSPHHPGMGHQHPAAPSRNYFADPRRSHRLRSFLMTRAPSTLQERVMPRKKLSEFGQLRRRNFLPLKDCARLFGVTERTIRRWDYHEPRPPHPGLARAEPIASDLRVVQYLAYPPVAGACAASTPDPASTPPIPSTAPLAPAAAP